MKTLKIAALGVMAAGLAACGGEPGSGVSSSSVNSSNSSVSSVSSVPTSSSSSSVSSLVGGVRPTKLEGFGSAVTGGAGGKVVTARTGTEINQALCSRAALTDPIIIYVDGTINHGNTTAQGCNTTDSVIEIKRTSNISIIGVGDNALFDQLGIHLREASNVIIQNVHIRNVKKSGTPLSNGGDAIGMESGVTNVWIDHNELEASGGEDDGYDSLLDMKAGVTNVTVSYNYYHHSGRGGLIGSSDSDNTNTNITFHHNRYENIDSRVPLLRHGLVHSYNNYFKNVSKTGINSRMGARALVEGNYFENVNNPILSKDSPEAGCWETKDNFFQPSPTYSEVVGSANVLAIGDVVNNQVTSTCSVSVPYSYTLDPVQNIPAIVINNAGTGKIGN